MNKADIDYETERDKRDMARAEETRKITSGMVFVLNKKESMYFGDIQFIYPAYSTTKLDTLIRKLYIYSLNRQVWVVSSKISSGLLQVYKDETGELIAETTIENIPNLRTFMEDFREIEDCLINWILTYVRL